MKSHTAIAPPRPTEADVKTCPKCGTAVNASAKLCVNCGHGFGGLSAQNRSRMRFASLFVGRSGAALGGGLATALLAGFLWAAVVRYTGFEIGWLAWGLGLGVGFCVAFIAREQNQLVGIAAAFVALLGWFAGKIAILYWAIPIITAAEINDLAQQFGGLDTAEHRRGRRRSRASTRRGQARRPNLQRRGLNDEQHCPRSSIARIDDLGRAVDCRQRPPRH